MFLEPFLYGVPEVRLRHTWRHCQFSIKQLVNGFSKAYKMKIRFYGRYIAPTSPDNPSPSDSLGRVCGPLFYQIGLRAERESYF
jgi:hypothetical protein